MRNLSQIPQIRDSSFTIHQKSQRIKTHHTVNSAIKLEMHHKKSIDLKQHSTYGRWATENYFGHTYPVGDLTRGHTRRYRVRSTMKRITNFISWDIFLLLAICVIDQRHCFVASFSSKQPQSKLTNAILRISFDGSRFTGWSAANGKTDTSLKTKRRKRNRRRGAVEEFHEAQLPAGFVRSVEGVLKDNLAKLYGDVDPNTRIVVEGCSRTDKGVHATCMIAQVYCLKEEFYIQPPGDSNENSTNEVIRGKRIPHPTSSTDDSCFEALPMNGNLSRMAFSFNRMRPPDVQITGIAPSPILEDGDVFHASLSSKYKTYEYRLSTGYLSDPTLRKTVWHVGNSELDLESIQKACELLRGTHDFSAFRGAARGSEEKKKRQDPPKESTICTLYDLRLDVQHPASIPQDHYFPGVEPQVQNYNIVVKGDRFLYKMVRFLVGSLLAVGNGKLRVSDIERALEHGNWDIPQDPNGKRKQFECAPAHGLTLTHIDYGENICFDWQPLRDPASERGKNR